MQNLGDMAANVLSRCVTWVGFEDLPFSTPNVDISHHLRLKAILLGIDGRRKMFRLLATRRIFALSRLVGGSVSRLVNALTA